MIIYPKQVRTPPVPVTSLALLATVGLENEEQMLFFCGDKPNFVACLSALLKVSLRFNWQSKVFWLETNLLPQNNNKKTPVVASFFMKSWQAVATAEAR